MFFLGFLNFALLYLNFKIEKYCFCRPYHVVGRNSIFAIKLLQNQYLYHFKTKYLGFFINLPFLYTSKKNTLITIINC